MSTRFTCRLIGPPLVCTSSSTRARRLRALRDLDRVEVQVRAASESLDGDAAHRDLLHELLVVGVERVEAVDLVVLDLVGRRVAKHHQRVEVATSDFSDLCGTRSSGARR